MNELLLFLGLSGSLLFPHSGGGDLTVGTYLTELTAIEANVGLSENRVHTSAEALVHWSALPIYDRFFGYSAVDPFLTLGADAYVGRGRDAVGPSLGAGAYYHLTESISLRASARTSVDVCDSARTLFAASAGIVYNF